MSCQKYAQVPSWAKDECLAICTGVVSAGSNSPDWNHRGNADGTSGQHETDFGMHFSIKLAWLDL